MMATTHSARPGRPRAVRRDGPLADLRPPLAHRRPPSRRAEPRRGPGLPLLYRTRPLGGDAGRPGRPRPRTPRAGAGTSPSTSTGSTTPSSIPGCWRSPGRSTASPTTGSRPRTIDELYDRADREADGAGLGPRGLGPDSQLEAVFLTNDFDDPLEGWDTAKYVPCLRTDDLVLKLHEPSTDRAAPGLDGRGRAGLRDAPPGDRRAVRAVRREGGEGLRDQPAARLRPAPGRRPSGR